MRSSPRLTRAAIFVSLGIGIVVAGCGQSGADSATSAARPAAARAEVISSVPVSAAGAREPLPSTAWALSCDLGLAPGATLALGLGYGAVPLRLAGTAGGLDVTLPSGRRYAVSTPRGWLGGGWWHLEATNAQLTVDGRSLPVPASSATAISFRRLSGHPQVAALIATPVSDRGLLLLHRLAELHARIPSRQFPIGATADNAIVYGTTYWTSGFWPGALWQAAAIAPQDGLFARWAISATIAHFGQERADTHDVGFEYGESSLAAWQALCAGRAAAPAATCDRLRASVLSAADELLALAGTNSAAGTIPTNSTSAEADTIVDSMMNIAILPWASRATGNPAYAALASHHATMIARLLVRPDGSTAQAVNFDRSTGRVLSVRTHQGISNTSTWSRGEGWALYGFSQAAIALRRPDLLRVALRVAGYVTAHLPADGVPLWDYDAPPGGPVDVSAGVITADGMFHLASACRAITGVCSGEQARWQALGERMLTAALARASAGPPLGYLGSQVLNERARGAWYNGAELIFGLTYALEGVRLEQSLHLTPIPGP